MEVLVKEASRQELYDKVWEISVAGYAKELDIPYHQLIKQVKVANIPIPPSGYWTKINFGKPVQKIPLDGPADAIVALTKTIETLVHRKIVQQPDAPKANKNKLTQKIAVKETASVQEEKAETEEPSEPVETYQQYGQTYNVYNRERLYREVWEKPVTEVAKQYKVSDVTIHKVCKSLDIPTPALGYWAKVRAGKPVKQIPLPKSDKPETKTGIQTGLEATIRATKELLQFLSVEDKSVVLSVAMQMQIPDENARMNSKIIAHRKKVVEWQKSNQKRDPYRNRRNVSDPPFLADTVSDASLPRVCRIFDALIKALEPLGCAVTDDLSFIINGETVRISVSESKDKITHVPTREENIQMLKYEEDKRNYSWASPPTIRKYDHVYNGKISITVGSEKSFRDCKSYVIEERLGDMLILLYEASNEVRLRREAREAEERKRQEEARLREERRERYNREIERTSALINAAEDFDTACKIRAYISAFKQKERLTEEEAEWVEWAMQKADWYDPTMRRKDESLGVRKHNENPERKKLEKSYSSWGW